MEQKKDLLQKFQSFCNKYLLVIIGAIVLGIGISSIFATAYLTGVYDKPYENTEYRFDNPIFVIALSSVLILGMFILKKITKKIHVNILVITLFIAMLVMQYTWVHKIKFIAISDQLNVVFLANDLLNENYDVFKSDTSYFGVYPFQLGIVYYISEAFKFIKDNSMIFVQELNVYLSLISMFIMYRIIANLFESKEIKRIGLFVIGAFSIYFMFFNVHIYGNIPGLAFSMIAVLFTIKYLKFKKKRYIGIIAITMAISILLKSNYNIFLCGILLCLGLDFLKDRKVKTIIAMVVIIVTYMLLSFYSRAHLEKLIGSKISSGMPMINYIYMGMEPPVDKASGWYTQGSVNLFTDNNYDANKTKQEAAKKIKARIKELLSNPSEFAYYYSDKLASTWLNPTFQVVWLNYPGVQMTINSEYKTYIENSPRIQSILSGDIYKLEEKYFNALQVVIFVFAGYGIFKNYKKDEVQLLVLPIIFLGGLVFHMFWETKAIYVLQYYFLLIPFACYGLNDFYKTIDKKITVKNKLLEQGKREEVEK